MTERIGPGLARLSGQIALLLGWSSDRFWNATPEELGTLLASGQPQGGGAIDRHTLQTLMERDRHG